MPPPACLAYHGQMNPRHTVYSYLAATALLGVLSVALPPDLASLAQGAWFILSLAAPYLWFYQDAAARGFARTSAWSAGIILLSVAAVPLYLFNSRPSGQRLKAIASALGVFVLSIVLPIVGAALLEAVGVA